MKSSGTITTLKELIVKLLRLYVENAKLTLTEKLTVLLSAALLVIISLVLGIFAMAFFAGAAVSALEMAMPTWLSYIIIGAFFVILVFAVFLLRKSFIVNPIARFISRLIIDESDKSID